MSIEASETMEEAIDNIAHAIRYGLMALGNADASTPMGALEAHGKCIQDAAERIAESIDELAEAIRDVRVKDAE